MKINKKLFSRVVSEPLGIQQHDDCTIEIHSMNQNEGIFNEYSRQGKFVLWTTLDGKNYRLITEDGYMEKCKDLYAPRVNKVWIKFWDDVDKGRKKIFLLVFLPFVVITSIALLVAMFAMPEVYKENQAFILIAILILYLIASVYMNRRMDGVIKQYNSDAIKEIKRIIGQDKFNKLMEEQRNYYDSFFAIPAEMEKETITDQEDEKVDNNEQVQ